MLLVFEQQRPQHNSKKDNHTNVLNEEQSIIEHWKNNKSIMRPKSCQSESDLFHAYMLILAIEKINDTHAMPITSVVCYLGSPLSVSKNFVWSDL